MNVFIVWDLQAAAPELTADQLKKIAADEIQKIMNSPFKEEHFEIYDKPDRIWETLEARDVLLVRSEWVMEQAHAGRVLDRRQDLQLSQPEAFMEVSELKLLAEKGPKSE